MSTFLDKVKQLIPGTTEHKELISSQQAGLEVIRMWESGELVYSQLQNRLTGNRDFYLGKSYKQFNQKNKEGELEIIANVGATVIDLIVYLLSNNPPKVQAEPKGTDRLSQVEASAAEDLANMALRKANFHKKFRDTSWMLALGGWGWWFPFWNTDVEFGKKKNRFDFTLLNPFTTRVFYQDSDYEVIPYFLTKKRMTPEAVFKLYEVEAYPDRDDPFTPRTITGEGIDDGKVTVLRRYDSQTVLTVINAKVVKTEVHGLDFTPIIQINNKFVVNDPHGHDDVFRMLPVAQELNMLFSAASEIARDLAYPSLLEYNNALGGRKPPKMRGTKIPVRRTDKGESLEYMVNPAQMEPLLKQIQLLLDLFHFVSLMPKAAAGVFDSSVTSGFQARIAMQPATLSTENKRIDFEAAIERLVKIALYMIEKNDPKSLEVDEATKLTELYDLNFRVVWPDNLPIDIAREIQNLVIGIQNSLTSVTQAVDKYNVMMGMGSSEETLNYLKMEAKDAQIAPDRALKVAQVKQTLSQIDQSLDSIRQKLGVNTLPEDLLPGGNETNAERAMTSPMEEEQQNTQAGAEAVPLESTGGAPVQVEGGTQ